MTSAAELAAAIDHTLLKAEADAAAVERLCAEARQHGFCSVCVLPSRVRLAGRALAGSPVRVCTVIGFPLGANVTEVKVLEARQAVAEGADELDMVLAVGALKDGEESLVRSDIAAVVAAAEGRIVKVILETCLLEDAEKARACELCVEAGASFVKTSTGFARAGATVADVALMRRAVGGALGVKASGGIRSRADALAMLEAGASRLGTSAGVAIVAGSEADGPGY